ncbi:MAG: fatty acid desaturase [Alphaproteobacteria bacterium]
MFSIGSRDALALIDTLRPSDELQRTNPKRPRLSISHEQSHCETTTSAADSELLPAGHLSKLTVVSDQILHLRAFVKRLARHCAAFKGADARRSALQLTATIVPFFGLLAAMYAAVDAAYWLTLLLAVPTAGLLVRLFIIQHDCGHGSYFKTRFVNDVLGRFMSVFTLTPYGHWKQHHALHHATSGNLDKRGFGDIHTLTVSEYEAMPVLGRLKYRLYRNPFIMILIGAPINFFVLQRFPIGRSLPNHSGWRSVLVLNLILAIVFGSLVVVGGFKHVMMTYLPVSIIGAWVGGWLFFVQHQFENTAWERTTDWDPRVAALYGSSYFELPRVLRWFTGNIGLHHIHHLCSRIPNYRLQECLDASPELQSVSRRLTFIESFKCTRLSLWDENRRKLVRFDDRGAKPSLS